MAINKDVGQGGKDLYGAELQFVSYAAPSSADIDETTFSFRRAITDSAGLGKTGSVNIRFRFKDTAGTVVYEFLINSSSDKVVNVGAYTNVGNAYTLKAGKAYKIEWRAEDSTGILTDYQTFDVSSIAGAMPASIAADFRQGVIANESTNYFVPVVEPGNIGATISASDGDDASITFTIGSNFTSEDFGVEDDDNYTAYGGKYYMRMYVLDGSTPTFDDVFSTRVQLLGLSLV